MMWQTLISGGKRVEPLGYRAVWTAQPRRANEDSVANVLAWNRNLVRTACLVAELSMFI
jgi:hypothetical protein